MKLESEIFVNEEVKAVRQGGGWLYIHKNGHMCFVESEAPWFAKELGRNISNVLKQYRMFLRGEAETPAGFDVSNLRGLSQVMDCCTKGYAPIGQEDRLAGCLWGIAKEGKALEPGYRITRQELHNACRWIFNLGNKATEDIMEDF